MAGLVLLVRNVLKLYADQRNSVMGTRLRTRMLWGGGAGVAYPPRLHVPVQLWPDEPRPSIAGFPRTPTKFATIPTTWRLNSLNTPHRTPAPKPKPSPRHCQCSIRLPPAQIPPATPPARTMPSTAFSTSHEITLQNGFAVVYREGKPIASFRMPQTTAAPAHVKPWLPRTDLQRPTRDSDAASLSPPSRRRSCPRRVRSTRPILAAAQRNDLPIFSVGDNDYALGAAAIKQGGIAVVGLPMPYGHVGRCHPLPNCRRRLLEGLPAKAAGPNPITLLLLMMTSPGALRLHLGSLSISQNRSPSPSKRSLMPWKPSPPVTTPTALVRALPLSSANSYAASITWPRTSKGSRRDVETSNLQLSAANSLRLEARPRRARNDARNHPQRSGHTRHTPLHRPSANRALTEMLDPWRPDFIHRHPPSKRSSPQKRLEQIDHLLRRSHRMGSASAEMEMTLPGSGTRSGATNEPACHCSPA